MYHGFQLIEKRFVAEVNAECLYFIHEQTGARLMKIAAEDPNKMFNIAFKTLPETDYGTPHILEHAVLNGSKNFPVKSPFDVLAKGSLNTFLNAMTGSDMTTYPVASMNDKDYFNLMHVIWMQFSIPAFMMIRVFYNRKGGIMNWTALMRKLPTKVLCTRNERCIFKPFARTQLPGI
jgi:hypothetical protein